MIYNEEQVEFMKSIGLDYIDFENLIDDDKYDQEWCDIEEKVGDYLVLHGLGKGYEVLPVGKLCYSILDKLP